MINRGSILVSWRADHIFQKGSDATIVGACTAGALSPSDRVRHLTRPDGGMSRGEDSVWPI